MDIINELWYGNVSLFEQCTRGDKRLKDLLKLVARNREELGETLTDKQKETLEKFEDCMNEMLLHLLFKGSMLVFGLLGRVCSAFREFCRRHKKRAPNLFFTPSWTPCFLLFCLAVSVLGLCGA